MTADTKIDLLASDGTTLQHPNDTGRGAHWLTFSREILSVWLMVADVAVTRLVGLVGVEGLHALTYTAETLPSFPLAVAS